MAGKSKSSPRKSVKSSANATASPIRMIVRRGALKRFESLKRKTAHLQVEVEWDQRQDAPREERSLKDGEPRQPERRRKPPFTWDLADFVVVTPKAAGLKAPDVKGRKK